MERRPIRWERIRQSVHWRERELTPYLQASVGWKRVLWWRSAVVEIRDNRYNWLLRFTGVSDPRRPLKSIGSLSHEVAIMALRKIERVAGGGDVGPSGAPLDATTFPGLWEHLSCARYGDGQARELSSLVIVGGGSEWRGCLSDKDNERVCWKAGASLEELLLRLEEAAVTEEPRDWRKAVDKKQPKRR